MPPSTAGAAPAPPGLRFTARAALLFREAIADAGGVEVFAVGRLDDQGMVAEVEVHCRGNLQAVPALLRVPRPGEVVIHNHPSGLLQASEADLHLAGRYGEDGVGMVITDNAVTRALWVVEPRRRPRVRVEEAAVQRFFEEALPAVLPGFEARPGQLEMALQVLALLNEGSAERPIVGAFEAGTGTGKSLAYLLPAVLWAQANEARVAVATYTIALQAQLAGSDLPLLQRAGVETRHALLSGRGNYLCRRRLAEAVEELALDAEAADDPAEAQAVRQLSAWAADHARGSRADLGFPVPDAVWEAVRSEADQTLRARCPHFARCFYYEARRDAAQARLLVLNQHLLLADLSLKGVSGGEGILPAFDRVIIDEAHHLDDAATGLFTEELGATGLRRALGALLPGKRPGALALARQHYLGALEEAEGPAASRRAREALEAAEPSLRALHELADLCLRDLSSEVRAPEGGDGEPQALRLSPALRAQERWRERILPPLEDLGGALDEALAGLGRVEEALKPLPEAALLRRPQPLFDLRRGARLLAEKAALVGAFRGELLSERVLWMEPAEGRRMSDRARLASAPIEVGPTLRARVFQALQGTVLTSATLAVAGSFEHALERLGLPAADSAPIELRHAAFPSPFDYARQALLALPRDLPLPEDPRFSAWAARFAIQAIRASGGGAFVLCTSHQMVEALHRAVAAELGEERLLLRQGELSRARLLDRFRADQDAVLFGTDSFWEGISVAGRALRLVIIPKLPFRVPTEPVQQARMERLQQRGLDAFRAQSLPEAVLRLRQGFGRLIRTASDRGAVAILDRRLHERPYGRVFLQSLPPARRVTGPGRAVLDALRAFFQAATLPDITPEDP